MGSTPDKNYPPGEFAGRTNETFVNLILAPERGGEDYDDVFKCSGVKGCTFDGVTVHAGSQRENAWDSNADSRFNIFRRLRLDAGRGPAVYLKGGFSDNHLDDIEITKGGGHSDLYIGDYSEQSRARSERNTFNNVRRSDGQPVRVSWNLLRAEKPRFTASGPIDYQYLWSIVRTIYVEWCYLIKQKPPSK